MFKWFRRRREAARAGADALVRGHGEEAYRLARILGSFRGAGTREVTLGALRAPLEAAGAEFIAENGGGAGVRLRKGGK